MLALLVFVMTRHLTRVPPAGGYSANTGYSQATTVLDGASSSRLCDWHMRLTYAAVPDLCTTVTDLEVAQVTNL
jgi:hypothetical protein